jgi:tetratricopeptide (TPR) repeat protein
MTVSSAWAASAPATAAPPASASAPASNSAAAQARAASGEAHALASAGASQLALKLIDASQPPLTQSPVAWAVWERARLDILSSAGYTKRLFARIKAYPDDVPGFLRDYAYMTGARAALGADDPVQARSFLRPLIWSKHPPAASVLTEYRQLVLRSYVVGGNLHDADRALAYLRRDGHGTDWRTREIAAEVAMERDHPRRAVHLLAGLKQTEVRPLMLLAELKAGIRKPARIDAMAARLARHAEKHKNRRLAGRFARVRAEAAKKQGDIELELSAMAAALLYDPIDSGPFAMSPSVFWHALVNTGLQLGNRDRLLLGAAGPWLKAASKENRSKNSMHALALLAAAGTRSPDPGARAASMAALGKELLQNGQGMDLALKIFSDSTLFPHPDRLPGSLRYQLLKPAVSTGRIVFASALVAGLDKPPSGVDAGDWQVQRARLFLLGGNDQSATRLLQSMVRGQPPVPAKKILPVVVDLETIGDNQPALGILQSMLAMQPAPPPKQARQILYWIGKAYSGLGSPLNAARAYLEAATFNSPYAMDQWAQTARYSAASALTQAGLYADARRIYEGLLNATSDPTQQAQIKQKLAAIRTLANRAGDKTGGDN